jgi:hypothetical protein
MLHPALTRALVTARIEDLHRAAARGARSVSPVASRTSHAWRPFQPPHSDRPPAEPRGLRAPRPTA